MENDNRILHLSGIVDDSIVDGPGMRYTVFVQGCPHHCPACHNPETHTFEKTAGYFRSIDQLMGEIEENPLLSGVTFSGGEPFCQAGVLADLAELIKARGLDLVCYTGYTYDRLRQLSQGDTGIKRLLDLTDILVDGPFVIEDRDLELLFRGSRNQRLIDLKAMREAGHPDQVILWQPPIW